MASPAGDMRHQLVQRQSDKWTKELIDLDHTNTLVKFKHSKTGSLDLTSSDPDQLTKLLAGEKSSLKSLFPDVNQHKDACSRARQIHRKIRTFREEQGVEVGRLACGFVKVRSVKAGPRPTLPLYAPLLLRPIALEVKTASGSDFNLTVDSEEDLNPVLLHALTREYGLDLAVDDITEKVATRLTELVEFKDRVDGAFGVLDELARGEGLDLQLEDGCAIGIFNYQKLPMVRDLQSAGDLLSKHELVASLAGHQESILQTRTEASNYCRTSPDTQRPEDEFLVIDANSSQYEAIDVALSGHHLLLEGPPGTGKSQTIANIIAGAAARGLSVLFVAEKGAAIQAVTDRLEAVKLDDLVLDLHRKATDKKHVAQQLADSLSRLSQEPTVDVSTLHELVATRRKKLNDYAQALHDVRQPWNLSAYQVREKLLQLGDTYRSQCAFRGHQLRDLHSDVVAKIEEGLRSFVHQGGLRILNEESPWAQAEVRDEEDMEQVLGELDNLTSRTLTSSSERMQKLVNQVGLPLPLEIANWEPILRLLDDVTRSVDRFGATIFGEELDEIQWATAPRPERKKHRPNMSWQKRRGWLKHARSLSTEGIRKKSELHEALTEVVRQRDEWRRIGGPETRPAQVIGLAEMMAEYQELRRQLAAVALSTKVDDLDTKPISTVTKQLNELYADRDMLFRLPQINGLRQRFTAMGLTPLLQEFAQDQVAPDEAALIFRHTWLRCLDDEFRMHSPALREFTPSQHDRYASEFQDADRRHLEASAARIRHRVAVTARQARDDFPDQTKLLRKESSKKTRHMPLRKLVEQAPDVLLALRPCWAMSPLVVSQTLPPSRLFDLVIFDEASQVRPHEAITSIMRGERLVVAGDEKQLPPSEFFDRQFESHDDEDEEPDDLADYESILTSLRAVVPTTRTLRWHYRSQDERLIAFSNKEIYNGDLVTFPGSQQENPLRFELVESDTASPGQAGLPEEEVRRVVDLVLEHAETRPSESLGVITLGTKHRDRIEQSVRTALQNRRDLDAFFSEDGNATNRFFVKNIETVQGDERDAIIFSIGVARSATGRVNRTGFGALNRKDGGRRLNVAVTRSRVRMTVVSSFPSSALTPDDSPTGTELLRRFLEMAERGADPAEVGRDAGTELNGFEQDIARRLANEGIDVYPQWGVSDYRIDFALAHPVNPSRMVLAVEADGDRYHQSGNARDRDRLRQEHLERLGWRFHRVWASAWFADPEGETRKIVDAWEKAVADVDNPTHPTPATLHAAADTDPEPEPSADERRGPRPPLRAPRTNIDHYEEAELIALFRWLLRDGLHLDRQERISQAMRELGYGRKGRKIVERLTRAAEIAQHLADKEVD
ncbi:very-short-patch-repair endonuclease [Prauserella isguenensis]|uniref:Very-short-patch-repair endonuclease n=1 Tax=Prauserella isguenensis TaxID=1470180 RepID=A0A839S8S6_9PSEU|nr:AAA domain-containing protein [Prauserella isguenensis]MBB3053089.1 very-short-patch-repair endonuclease [Prauserella isguenensis]